MTKNKSYQVIMKGYDWGPGNSKIVLNLKDKIVPFKEKTFRVQAEKEHTVYDFEKDTTTTKRQTKEIEVMDQYLSDAKGNRVENDSQFVTLELEVHPANVFTNPYDYQYKSGLNTEVGIDYTLTQTKDLYTIDNKKLSHLEFTKTDKTETLKPEIKHFSKDTFAYSDATYGPIEFSYMYFVPEENQKERPLMILLHGAGEGGTNPEIPLYGNKGVALAAPSIQNYFNGAYVLAPQAKTMWMDDGTGEYTKEGTSKYTKALLHLIETFISEHKVNPKKVYLIGGSNGGFMTLNLLIEKSELFAAGVPICQAYHIDWVREEELETLKNIPMWFIHSVKDPVVPFDQTTEPIVNQLRELGAPEVKLSTYEDIKDTSGLYKDEEGQPYSYNNHWSWVHLFNDEVSINNQSVFKWLASQSLEH